MKKSISILLLIGLAFMPAYAAFSNTYARSRSVSFDWSTNMLFWTEMINGTTTDNSMNALHVYHTPNGQVTINGHGSYNQGQAVYSSAQMTYSNTWAFDLSADCGNPSLFNGTCYGESDPNIVCPVAGTFLFPHVDIQIEKAVTTSQVYPIPMGGWYPENPYCSARSSPPDWNGPVQTNAYGTGYFRCATVCFREVPLGQSFTGVPWICLPVGPCKQVPAGPAPDCTNYDKGIHPVY